MMNVFGVTLARSVDLAEVHMRSGDVSAAEGALSPAYIFCWWSASLMLLERGAARIRVRAVGSRCLRVDGSECRFIALGRGETDVLRSKALQSLVFDRVCRIFWFGLGTFLLSSMTLPMKFCCDLS